MNERVIAKHTTILLQLSILILALSGCVVSKVSLKPVTGYPQAEKINLKVQLMLTEEMCSAVWHMNYDYDDGKAPPKDNRKLDFPLGDDFCLNTRKVANILFTDVIEKKNSSSITGIDAILTPKILTLIRNRPPGATNEQTTTIIVKWSLKDNNGNIIWVDTITAQGKANLVDTQKQVQDLFNDLFQKSFKALSSSVEIRRFALAQNR